MSTTIPYDPTLALGNIVPADHLSVLEAISKEQTPIDEAQNELNSLILLKRKLEMTADELVNMKIDPSKVNKSMQTVGKQISSAAQNFADTSVKALPKIASLRKNIPQIGKEIESPIDYNKSQIKKLPLSADSLTMDAQYFSFDEVGQSSSSAMASMKAFISESTRFLGDKNSFQATTSAMGQVNKQREHHDIQGTLVITASCTHKEASVFAPFIIDVDKGIRAWNELFPNDMIKTNSKASVVKIAAQQQTKQAKFYNLLSGATYGSSFVGMVHVLKDSGTTSSQTMYSVAESLQDDMDVGSWFASEKGGFGVASSFANSAKNLLSQQDISSHVSIVTMGVIPTITANDVTLAVKQFSNFSPDKMMAELSTLQSLTVDGQTSVASAANNARTGGQMVALQASKIQSVMSAVGEIEDGKNKMLDINSLMTAFTDFVNKVSDGNLGVPITYFLKPITASQLAQMWVAKYLPKQYITSAGDDSTPEEPSAETRSPEANEKAAK